MKAECLQTFDSWIDDFHGRLPEESAERDRMNQHLGECEGCRDALARARQTMDHLRAVFAEAVIEQQRILASLKVTIPPDTTVN